MKCLMVLALAATAFGQNANETTSTTTVTEYFPGCSTLPVTGSYTSTTTATTTQTLPCEECEHSGVWTTYVTVYEEICPTGLAPATYTVTEECSETGQPRPSDHIPSGFCVTSVACAPCAEQTVVLTTPVTSPTAPAAAPPATTMAPIMNGTVCHSCNHTVPTNVQYGGASSTSLGLIVGLFSFIAAALIVL